MPLRMTYFAISAALMIALSFSLERQAHAYVDPGSSLLLFQSLSAMVTGALFYFRRRLKSLFTKAPVDSRQSRETLPPKRAAATDLRQA